MRRAIWNLATNALDYGAKGAPVDIGVATRDDDVEVTVNNEGAPIPGDKPFALRLPHTAPVPRAA